MRALLPWLLLAAPWAAGAEPEDEDGEVVSAAERPDPKCKAYARMQGAQFPPTMAVKVFTAEELRQYDGYDCKQPLLLAIAGEVYDVGPGKQHYAPGGGYQGFAGRDASRAFVTGEFNSTGLRAAIDDFTPEQVQGVLDWRKFYREHKPDPGMVGSYRFVGVLDGEFYDAEGKRKPALDAAEEKMRIWERTQEVTKKFDDQFKSCNSRTESKNEYFEVWCDRSYHGDGTIPRHLFYNITSRPDLEQKSRCACVTALQVAAAPDEPQDPPPEVQYRFRRYRDCLPGSSESKCLRPKGAAAPGE
eukprot:TRINITY_DN115_c1_g1_i1.p1 TRINITY_DN115_c1_g1~~TRINITY_DN115_c1_g1_i1.p1  ORF type:complete len:322 (+),score=118.85 TRINITY_DN115_c1_g1_i1:63-968(+)